MTLDLMISANMHNILDGVAAATSILATIALFVGYRRTRSTAILIMAIAFGATAAIEMLHEVSDSRWLMPFMTSSSEQFMPWSWHASRMFLACGFLLAALHLTRDNFGAPATVNSKKFPSVPVVLLLLVVSLPVTVYGLLAADLPSIYYSQLGLLRFPELISGAVFLGALFLLLRKGNWQTDSYGHWINLMIVLSLCTQFFCMAFSQKFLDSSFAAAHLLKIASYSCIIYGFFAPHKAVVINEGSLENKPRGLGIGVKVAVVCGFIGIICVIPVAIYSAGNLHKIAADNGMEKLSLAAVNTSRELEDRRRRINRELGNIAEARSIQEASGDAAFGSAFGRAGQNLLRSESKYLSLTYLDAESGNELLRLEKGAEFGLAARNRDVLQAGEQQLLQKLMDTYMTSGVARSKVTMIDGGPDATLGVPAEATGVVVFRDGSEVPAGVLVAYNDISDSLTSRELLNTEAQLYVLNSEGRFLINPDSESAGSGSEPSLRDLFPGIQIRPSDTPDEINGQILQRPSGEEILVGFNQDAAYAVSGEPLLYIYTGSREQMEMAATLIGENLQRIAQFNLLIAIAIGWLFARRISKPAQKLSEAAVEFGRSGTVTVLPDPGSDEIGLLSKSLSEMMQEVTSQREKLELLSSAVESSVDSTLITSIRGTIQYVNPEYERYAGVSADDILGMNVMELPEFVDNRHILSEAPAKKGTELVWVGEMRNKRADNKWHDEHVTIAPIRNAEGEQINQSMILEDITERKEMERFIDLKTEELQRSNRDLEQFAYVASHDLKAPLRAIEVLVSWLKDDLEDFEGGDVHENLDLLDQRTVRLARLLDDLLEYSRAGRKIGGIKTINTKEFVEDIATLIAPPEGFVIEADDSLPEIVTHHAPLETVFRNLMSNAIKHSPDASKGRIHVAAEDRGSMVEFTVQDNGTGIPQEYAEKVFKMFQTLKARDEMEGSGMGLAIVKRIIDWQLGEIWFEDGPDGVGTVFHFTWNKQPVELPDMEEAEAGKTAQTPALSIDEPLHEEPDYIEPEPMVFGMKAEELTD